MILNKDFHRKISNLQTIFFASIWLLYCFAAFTPLSSHFPFFSWRLYAEVKSSVKFLDVQYSDEQGNWHSAYRDTYKSRRGFQVFLNNVSWSNQQATDEAVRYVQVHWALPITSKYQVVEQNVSLLDSTHLDPDIFFPRNESFWNVIISGNIK